MSFGVAVATHLYQFHFSGSQATNKLDKPEWFFQHVSSLVRDRIGFLSDRFGWSLLLPQFILRSVLPALGDAHSLEQLQVCRLSVPP